ncbi:hypothetical protein ACFSQQ_00740 [Mesorhizobium kowhaii]|uniref:hypothetical protein n=1 Tax=Mesorhizobium kowhaii TaxID=1300272 RepID=UPI0035E4D6B2
MEFFSCLQLIAVFEEILSVRGTRPPRPPSTFPLAQQTKPHPIYRELEAMAEHKATPEKIFYLSK